MAIEAVTFDFWDTLAIDDSDEPKRAARGLASKAEARRELFARHIEQRYPEIGREEAGAAYGWANERFRDEWQNQHRTPGVTARIVYAYERLGLGPQPGEYGAFQREVEGLVREIEEMEVRIPPEFAPGAHEAIPALAREYRLGIISDTIHTHGRGIRFLLERQGLLPYFSYCLFSDEVRASKPANRLFLQAVDGLKAAPWAIAHVGDRESNDVAGPQAVGMRAVLFTGIVDRGSAHTRAQAVCRRLAELPEILRRLR